MVTNVCPACGAPLAPGDINIAQGVALCRACGKLSQLADVAGQPVEDARSLATPPVGCSYEEPLGGGLIVRASLRSFVSAAGLLFVCLFWNGITSVFVVGAVGGLYARYVGPLPHWLPGMFNDKSISSSNSSPAMPVFILLFMTPFIAIGLGMFLALLTSLMGRVEISVMGSDGRVRTGFGPFNWTRRFDASQVKRVSEGLTTWSQNNQRKAVIQLEADRTIKFGSSMTDERRTWMMGILHLLLVTKNKAGRIALGLSPLPRG